MSKERDNVVIAAFTEEQTARLTGVSTRQLRYWAEDDFFVPSLKASDDEELAALRLYSFRDLVCLKVLSALRNEASIPLKHLREVKGRLAHLGDDLWARTTLFVLGKRVVFENPQTGQKEEAASGQGVLQIPLQVITGNMQEAVRDLRRRDEQTVGRIDTKRGGAKNPVIAGTRVPVKTIKSFAEAGYSPSEIVAQYPTLTEDDVRAAISYEVAA